MDSYLESLVKRDEYVEVETSVETVDESNVIEVEEALPEAELEVVPVDTEEPLVDEDAEEVVAQEEEKASEPTPEDNKQPVISESEEHVDGDKIKVENIRIYKTPDSKQVARNFTGNVVYRGKISEFTIIDYMRHGFGVVRGYTLNKI